MGSEIIAFIFDISEEVGLVSVTIGIAQVSVSVSVCVTEELIFLDKTNWLLVIARFLFGKITNFKYSLIFPGYTLFA